nr:HAD-IA family hydrolase [Chthonobacter albigriseus]
MDDVVYTYDRAARIRVIAAATGLAPGLIEERIWLSGFQDEADAGLYPTAEAYLDGWRERLGTAISAELWTAARAAGMTPIPGTLALLDALSRRTEASIAVLTNNGPMVAITRHRLVPELAALTGERFLVSSAFGTRKPDPEVYRRALARLGYTASAAFFVDDRPENVAGAATAGLTAHRFTTPDMLSAAIASFDEARR